MSQPNKNALNAEQRFIEWIIRLIRSDFTWLGRILLKGLRFSWRHRPGPIENSPKDTTDLPTGPYVVKRRKQIGDILIWVPRKIESYLIDDLTGGFGYSHITVDTGEVDAPTQKPVMIEVTVGQTVERKFQDEYGPRSHARIPISKTGIDAGVFINCVKSKLGEQYSNLEALTLGEIDDPSKQVCSTVASECLPESVQREIAKARRLGLLRGTSVSVHSPPNSPKTKIFVSPNGLAQYYGAPKGEKLVVSESLIEPHPIDTSVKQVLRKHGWKAGLILVALGGLVAASLLFILNHKKRFGNRSPIRIR
ncbi:MAG: hypothetical protein P4L50_25880 [Anaerolineaceae bacterium]|nr:hypothetical protein [Anaerolineaceae bacterium]